MPNPWVPQLGPQLIAIDSSEFVDEVLYGGARGGGKSDFLLGDFGMDVGIGHGENWRGILFRRTYGELEELIARSKSVYYDWFPGSVYKEGAHTWHFPWGETLRMRYLEKDADADRYQGHQYPWIGWDELGQWATLYAYNKLKACLRSAHNIPNKRIRSSANPGGPGHQVVKAEFISAAPPLTMVTDDATEMTRMYIPARVQDNQILLRSDPKYVNRLRGVGSEALVRAWLEGDWDAVEGAYFDCWSNEMVIKPFTIPEHWTRIRSFDWGSARPFSIGWTAVASEDYLGPSGVVPKNALVRYREWYGVKHDRTGKVSPNEGLKMKNPEIAQGILEREMQDDHVNKVFGACHDAVADPSIFKEEGGPSIAEQMFNEGVSWRKADNARISGWQQMRTRMIGEGKRPMLYIFDTCVDSIRTIPVLQHDEVKPEDLDTDGEDHAADEMRYSCMARPYAGTMDTEAEAFDIAGGNRETWDQMMQRMKRNRYNA